MTININQQGSYQIRKGDIVFLEGHQVNSLNILLQGKLDVFISSGHSKKKGGNSLDKCYRIYVLEKNIFIGANDIISNGKYNCSYQASEDCTIYAYPLQSVGQTWALINSQKDYGSFIVNSLFTMINNSCSALQKLLATVDMLRIQTENLVTFFWVLKEFNGFDYTPSQSYFREGLDKLSTLRENGIQLVPIFDQQFIANEKSDVSEADDIFDSSSTEAKIEYYEHINSLPIDLRKSFFGADMYITSYHCREEANCFDNVLSQLRDAFSKADDYFTRLYSDNNENIYSSYLKATSEMASSGQDFAPALQALEYIIKLINEIVNLYQKEYFHKCETDLDYIEHSYNNLKTSIMNPMADSLNNGNSSVKATAGYQSIPEELKDSASKILEYSGLPKEQTDAFMLNLIAFRNMKDRLSVDEDARNIRSNAIAGFFDIYEAVFKKATDNKDNSRLINMFLNYAYMDERMLTPEQTLTLYKLAGKDAATGNSSIYTMRNWLTKVYNLECEPSMNEFGQDYSDMFREMKKRGQVTDKDKNAYDTNRTGKLAYETGNMLKTTQKLCHGQISVYFPVLHKEMLTRDLDKAYVTPSRVRESLDKILEVDFSAFYREIHFIDQNKAIEKEIIMKSLEPHIILIPIFGSRAMMWQEISCRNRNTPGRFLLPAFTDEDLDAMMLRLVGNFRWELCRTMMGTAWNDVTQPSLTSEYTDYIQFFKKNKDLSDEAKDKIKAQSVKYHGKTRDIFTSDYEIWINNESKGNVRLNKVLRNIFYRYCPFNKSIREQLEKQPMYAETAILFKNQRAKIARDLDNRYSKYMKNNGTLDPALEHNLMYYRDL